ncbi:rho guanine nucleotide exchange factor 10-like protein isoform X1 [Anopheles stephensi]|uniref:rho guanine nucleotide exchange factor 10-like protein isoform X1 n=2 Tax=Anopheles stephensi TaxID=30069 RepID=UPI001658A836|nr:rho guanine nucleotide exchange factor 10-like protein isoform X1 [Anopheles stephensi]XP_035897726.1 rho guanine nucleotide exchange factor 10-like protein isoform X1 [Anopheles stephensi]XP_035897736.1 rho guanine nucleotide exchange factor 10-like protein isoform X1 [Anopheles stephensi]
MQNGCSTTYFKALLLSAVQTMERSRAHSNVPNFLARLFRSDSTPVTNNRTRVHCTPRATQLELHDLRRVRLPPMPAGLPRNDQNRWYVFDELITHEQSYLDALHKLQYVIFNALEATETFVAKDTLQTIFGTHQRICRLHQFGQVLLEQCVREWPGTGVAGWMILAMVEQPALLHWYDLFIRNHKRTMELYTAESNRNRIFAWFVSAKLRELGEQRTFADYFIMPVQRMPQLLMQVRELAKHTHETHPDRALLDRCVRRITYIGEQLNAATGRSEAVRTVLHAIEQWDADRSRTFAHDAGQCLLLYSEPLSEMFRNGIGERIVLLLSDRLVCAKLPAQQNAGKPSASFRQQPNAIGTLTWVLPLQEFEVECSDQVDSRLGSTESLASIDSIRDFGTLSSVRDLMSTFHRSHDTLNVDTCSEELNKIWSTVLSSDEAEEDATLIHVKPAKGRRRILKTKTADGKKEWCYTIRITQLALRAENSPGWWNSAVYAPYEALFCKTLAADNFASVWSVTAACCFAPNTTTSAYSNELFRVWSNRQHVLWLILKDSHSSKISLYTHDRRTNRIDARATICLPTVRVSSVVYVPVGQVGNTVTDTVWITTRSRLMIYSATYPMIEARLKSIRIKGTPNQLFYHDGRVFCGTVNERLLIFSLKVDGGWDLQTPQQCRCGTVAAMCVVSSHLYMAIRAHLRVYDSTVGAFVKHLASPAACSEDRRYITLLERSVHGLWVARHHCGTVSLYHAKHRKHLLDVNIGSHVARFLAEATVDTVAAPVHVLSMQIIENFLWVGTNVGLVLSMQLPQSGNVPIMVDQMAVAYHGHLEDVAVILALPSLRAHPAMEPEAIDVDPLLVDKLYKNTRNPARDLTETRLGIEELQVSFIDLKVPLEGSGERVSSALQDASCDDGEAHSALTASTVRVNDTSRETDDGDDIAASPDKADERTATETSIWAPNSMLIITGGRGYIKRQHNIDHTTCLQGSSRSRSTASIAELTDSWRLSTVDEKENVILWEKRYN